jgi:hypothetical protein
MKTEKTSIYTKIHQAKQEIGKVSKTATNPHFKKSYADLNSLIEAVESILLEKGLLLLQPLQGGKVITMIFDVETGESIQSDIDLPQIQDPQKLGSAITYFRRYTLQSLLSLQAVDDDGNLASQPTQGVKPLLPFTKQVADIHIPLKTSLDILKKSYTLTTEQETKYLNSIK